MPFDRRIEIDSFTDILINFKSCDGDLYFEFFRTLFRLTIIPVHPTKLINSKF